jgi:hypothetical protein
MDFLANKQFFSKLHSKRNSWTHISIPICFWMLLMCFVVLPVLTKDTDAQLLSGQRRNETIATGPSSDQGLLSIIRNPGTLTANLSSVAERMLGGIEEKIDARLQAIKARLDEIAAVAKPAIIAAAAGVLALAALIVAFIILHWYDRFRQGRRHRKVLSDLYGHIHQELKENGDLLHKKSSSGTNPDINDDDNNNNHPNQQYLPAELSNNALKAAISAPFFWDLSPNVQHGILKLDVAINKYNRVLMRTIDLRESIVLGKIDEQFSNKVLRGYNTITEDNARETIDLSTELRNLMEEEGKTARGKRR